MPTVSDHVLAVFLAVILPAWGKYRLRRFVEAVRTGDPTARLRAYRGIIILQWSLVAILLLAWIGTGRKLLSLGFAAPLDARALWGVGACLGVLGLCGLQQRAIAALSDEDIADLVKRAGNEWLILPTNHTERKLFSATSLTAGACEEILYRGFLLWYLHHWFTPWQAISIGAVAFGVAHAYQGLTGMLKTGVVGFLMGAVYHATGSLLWPMVAHALIDVFAGVAGVKLADRRREAAPAPTGAGALP